MLENEKVILYTIGCPKCLVLEKKLDQKGIAYTKCEDLDLMTELGFKTAPVLEINGERYDFSAAVKKINEIVGGNA